jgi:hypothetical protein
MGVHQKFDFLSLKYFNFDAKENFDFKLKTLMFKQVRKWVMKRRQGEIFGI